jgi:RNA polymerase II elongation factor ELL
MGHAQETTLHELYLRASSITKKTAPLKLYANVVGKFTVERELHDDVCDKLRESTQDAVNQRMTRTTQFIDKPPEIQSNSKKRKEPPSPSTMFRKTIRQSDKLMSTSNPLTVPNRTSTLTAQGSKEGSTSLRTRVVHCLAIADRTEDELVRLVGGLDCSPLLRREIHDLLEQVSESYPVVCPGMPNCFFQLATTSSNGHPPSGNSSRSYHLKSVSWKEVRPYVWPKLSVAERSTMARSAKHAFQELGIPESDPAWDHIRNSAETNLRKPQASAFDTVGLISEGNTKLEIPKRGVSSQEVREKKAKQKQKINSTAEIMMKDESFKVTSRLSQANEGNAGHIAREFSDVPQSGWLESEISKIRLKTWRRRNFSDRKHKTSKCASFDPGR